ncbi:MAG: type II secretion system protein GspF, partial [Sideroxydans sp. RIFOXYB12_FULL_59_6]
MAAFHYNALDAAGKASDGMIEADSARLARTQLRDKGLFVVELDALSDTSTQKGARSFHLPFRKRIPLSEVSLMLRQLATLLEAGLPLEQALAVLIEQGDNPAMRQVIAALRSEVLAGSTLARAMEKHRDTFPDIHRALIRAGEESGELDTVMDKLASYSESQQALQQKIGLAMVYPAIVIFVAVLVVGGLLLFVVPPVVEVFQQTKQNLPFLTRALIALSDFLSAAWLYLIALFVVGGIVAQRALQLEALRYQFHLKLLRLPVLG